MKKEITEMQPTYSACLNCEHASVENDSFDHEWGGRIQTERLPDYVVCDIGEDTDGWCCRGVGE